MAIWSFDTFETDDLERLVEMKDELTEMGLDLFDEEMMAEVYHELSKREEEAEDEDDQHTIIHT